MVAKALLIGLLFIFCLCLLLATVLEQCPTLHLSKVNPLDSYFTPLLIVICKHIYMCVSVKFYFVHFYHVCSATYARLLGCIQDPNTGTSSIMLLSDAVTCMKC